MGNSSPLNVEILSRIQFAFTIAFHYIYPPLSIGLGVCLVIMEGLYLKTGDKVYEQMTKFWIKIFALIFGIGVATGIVMEFEFGTNWATYSRYVGDIFGVGAGGRGHLRLCAGIGFPRHPALRLEPGELPGAFHRHGAGVLGSMFSALWIVVANSWQQTPAGYRIVGEGMQARAEITDFWAMVFNPSRVERYCTSGLAHFWRARSWC